MSEKQPEALRLADELVETPFQSTRYIAAAELRRLHEVNQELLEALEAVLALIELGIPIEGAATRKVRAAIAKATGEQA